MLPPMRCRARYRMSGEADRPDSVHGDVRANTVRMPEELWQALQLESERTGQSTSELVRQAVTLHVAFLAAVRTSNEQQDLRVLLDDILRRVSP
jgi:hypothetical protein